MSALFPLSTIEPGGAWRTKVLKLYALFLGVALALFSYHAIEIRQSNPTDPSAEKLTEVRMLYSQDYMSSPPPLDAPWKNVTLPQRLDVDKSVPLGEFVWYDVIVEAYAPEVAEALYIARASMNAEIYLNGEQVGYFGPMTGEYATRNWNRPFYVYIKPFLQKAGKHRISVQLRTYQGPVIGLSPIWIGPSEHLREVHKNRLYAQVSLLGFSNSLVMAAMMGLIALFVFKETRSKLLLWLIFGCAFWLFRNIGLGSTDSIFPNWLHVRLMQFSMLGTAAVMIKLVMDYCKIPSTALTRRILLIMCLTFPVTVAGRDQWADMILNVFNFAMLLFSYWCFWLLIRKAEREKDLATHVYSLAVLMFCLASTHDMLFLLNVVPFDGMLFNQYLGLMIFVSLLSFIAVDYSSKLKLALGFNSTLKDKLVEQENQLRDRYQEMQANAREKATLLERNRIMADMHDGLGAYLVTAIHQVRQMPNHDPNLVDLLERGLRDLQLTIDSMEPVEGDLGTLAGTFRYRIARTLKSAGMDLKWQVAKDLPPMASLDGAKRLHLLRFLQEVFNNILKHAHASVIEFSLQSYEGQIVLRIADDGKGFVVKEVTTGQGIENLRMRAKKLGAKLEIQSIEGSGTTVVLIFNAEASEAALHEPLFYGSPD